MLSEADVWALVDKRGPDECWPWLGGRATAGYGRVRFKGRLVASHRLIYTFVRGPIAPGMEIAHTCDSPSCCNPAHLSQATHAENLADMARKGRAYNGVHYEGRRRGGPRMPAARAAAIRRLHAEGHSVASLAAVAGVSATQVRNILARRAFAKVK